GLLAGIHGLFSRRNCCLARRITCGYPWPELEGKRFGMIQERFRSSAWCLRDRMSTPTQVLVEGSDGSLIPLSHGSFDVIVGMDWLSKRKFVIVCHEMVVKIPLEDDEILRVHGERTQGVVKTLMNTKSKEEHEVHLKLVLELLRKEKLYAKFSNYKFVSDALSRKERVKSRRERGMILAAQSEAFKQENVLLVGSVMDKAHASKYLVHPGADKTYYNLGDMYLESRVEKDIATYVACSMGRDWESSLIGPELVLETTDKVVLVKEKPKATRDRQKSYVDFRRKPLEFEVGDQVLLKVSHWKDVVCFGKKVS
ncbi:hypothetical protein Tco_0761345, partial [Tanacetum coccineum]